MPSLLNLSNSSVSVEGIRPYDAAQKWVEFIGEGSLLDPLTLNEGVDDGLSGFAYEGSVPPIASPSPLFID
jgi:hypothetical protein